jgi:expansin (peptidoglycan-binding protein)
MNHTDYAGSAACGACVRIDGPDGSVDVRIVDRCPECPEGDIDLSPEAFSRIAELSAGRVPISWQYVECPIDSPVVFHFKDGSNQWWTAVQVRNHRHAIAELAYQNDDGDWVDVGRLDYNYFVEDAGMGPGPYTFRIRSVLGEELVESDVAGGDDVDVAGSSQFPTCE